MPDRLEVSHRIVIDVPIGQAFMLFTPAGEELWVPGWRPTYVHPQDGRTEAGMVFTTGEGAEFTLWTLVDFDRAAHRSRYLRCTPASRTSVVDVHCTALDERRTEVAVSYTLTALNAAGRKVLEGFEGDRFAAMIDGWAHDIATRGASLSVAHIR